MPPPKGKPTETVNKAGAGDDRLAMLKELAKLTKPTGKSAQGKGEEVDD
jgi:hypothetical protein